MNACLAPLPSVDGAAITTVEGIGSTKTGLHPVQASIATKHGSQCGFCTPGIVMSMYSLLRRAPEPTDAQLGAALDGNLCRCTGYRPILEGFRSIRDPAARIAAAEGSQEPRVVTEEELQDASLRCKENELHAHGRRVDWHRPTTLQVRCNAVLLPSSILQPQDKCCVSHTKRRPWFVQGSAYDGCLHCYLHDYSSLEIYSDSLSSKRLIHEVAWSVATRSLASMPSSRE